MESSSSNSEYRDTERSGVTTNTSVITTSRVTVVEESDSDGEYISTVEDNSQIITVASSTPVEAQYSLSRINIPQSHTINQTDVYPSDTDNASMREMLATPRRASLQKLSLVNQTPEMTPLLIRVNPIQRAQPANITGTRVSSPVQVVHFVQAKKYIVKPQIVFSLEAPLVCYEVAPSFGMQTVEQQFILTPAVQAVKVLVLPSKQKIKAGNLPRKTSVPHLLLPPEGPNCAKALQPLWDTITFTIAYGKHVAVEYNIFQVPMRKVKLYKAEKQKIKEVDAAVLYRETPKNTVVVYKAGLAHQLRLSTVERQDPQLVKLVRVEQNRWETADYVKMEVHATSSSTVASEQRYSRRK